MWRQDLDTPFVIIDLDRVERNINRMQNIASSAGVGLRPHAKTHKMPYLAHQQIAAGAIGITVAKLGEAEVMADAGIRDILIAYPIVGAGKVERLVRLARRVNLTVSLDSIDAASAISTAAVGAAANVNVLVEMDCGFHRVGVAPGKELLNLAEQIVRLPGLTLRGVATFAGHSYDASTEEEQMATGRHEGELAVQAGIMLREHGIPVDVVSVGSTPSSRHAARVPGVTEIRPGTYVFGDLMQAGMGSHPLEDCALSVRVTVVSRPTPDRAVVDAGTKVFTSDGGDSPIGTGRGYVLGHPEIHVQWFTEEHGMLHLSVGEQNLTVGDTLEVIPVHACAVINMVDEVALVRGDLVEAIVPVSARGKIR